MEGGGRSGSGERSGRGCRNIRMIIWKMYLIARRMKSILWIRMVGWTMESGGMIEGLSVDNHETTMKHEFVLVAALFLIAMPTHYM